MDAEEFQRMVAQVYNDHAAQLHTLANKALNEYQSATTPSQKQYWHTTCTELADASQAASRAAKAVLSKKNVFAAS
jgi:hypothetical protein